MPVRNRKYLDKPSALSSGFFKAVCFILSCIGMLFLVLACSNEKQLPPEAYMKHIASLENGLHKVHNTNLFRVEVQYKPLEYQILEKNKGKQPGKAEYQKLKQKYKDGAMFTLRIGLKGKDKDLLKHGISSKNEYFRRLQYFTYQFEKDIYLKTGGGTLVPCSLYHFERSYDLKSDRHMVLGFDISREKLQQGFSLEIKPAILNTGKVHIHFKKETIQHIPKLAINL